MKRLLWVGDAGVPTGFARSTHAILDVLKETWEISVIGLNYQGAPHRYPYDIWPANPEYVDPFGIREIPKRLGEETFDLAIVQNDPWNFPQYLRALGNVPTIGVVAVDGLNCRGRGLNGLTAAIFWSNFGLQQARLGGYTGRAAVVPLGVDLTVYKSMDKVQARKNIGLPKRLWDSYIVGNVNRNQPRKRFDLTIQYFADWIKKYNIDNAYLYLHAAPTGDAGFDCGQLASYYGIGSRLILSEPEIRKGIREDSMADTYNSFDVQFTTTQGEGFGLCTLEGMACGVPQIFPDWAALGDWAKIAACAIPCSSTAATINNINAIGGVMDKEDAIEALQSLYAVSALREALREKGLELAAQKRFNWRHIGELFAQVIEEVLAGPVSIKTQEPATV
jgi:glycosyltransferase involved in cell wall biosynthesis